MYSTVKKMNSKPTNEASRIEGEFKKRIQNAKYELESKFIEFYTKLSGEETRLFTRLGEIESDAIHILKKSSVALLEITQAIEQILEIFKTNITSQRLLKNILEIYDKEIEEIKTNSKSRLTKNYFLL